MPDNTPWTVGKNWSAVAAVAVPLLTSMALGYLFRPDDWYKCLKKSCMTPPGWVFGVVWLVLYIFIGVAMVAACYETDHPWTWTLPVINIIISLTFAPVMFSMHRVGAALLITILCLILGIATLSQFATANNSNLATGLMVPYVLWLIFATALASYIWMKNCPADLKKCEKMSRGCASLNRGIDDCKI